MLESHALRPVLIGILVVGIVGCTAQEQYRAVNRENSIECDLKLSEPERERCQEQLVTATYEEYQRLRASAIKRAGNRSPGAPPEPSGPPG